MLYEYDIKNEQLTIDLEPEKNRGRVFFTGVQISELSDFKELNNGKVISLGTNDRLFIKFINEAEGFTIMLNNLHVNKSAGHPKKLLNRAITPLKLAALIFTLQFIYVLFDLWKKNELSTLNFNANTFIYLAYFTVIIVAILIGIEFTRRGNWKGAAIGFTLLLFNLLFSIGLGLYYNTGFNVFIWSFLTAQIFVLILLFTHIAVIKYVRTYSRSLKHSSINL